MTDSKHKQDNNNPNNKQQQQHKKKSNPKEKKKKEENHVETFRTSMVTLQESSRPRNDSTFFDRDRQKPNK